MSETLIPNSKPTLVRQAVIESVGNEIPTAHLLDPRDETHHTALCGEWVAGVPASPPYRRCVSCDLIGDLLHDGHLRLT